MKTLGSSMGTMQVKTMLNFKYIYLLSFYLIATISTIYYEKLLQLAVIFLIENFISLQQC